MMTQKQSNSLNPEQLEAIEHEEGPLLVLAGAGSGKTRVVTQRIVRLIEKGVEPQSILGLTFTNKAANEMQERVRSLIHSSVLICTFHSLGARILRESISRLGYKPHFTIYDEEDCDKVLRQCLTDLGLTDAKLEPKAFRHLISQAKSRLQEPNQIANPHAREPVDQAFPTVYAAYQQKLFAYNALDFDDLLFLTVKLFQQHPEALEHYQKRWRYLSIDEYQDTNASQYEIVRLLVSKHHNLFVVGDPDQSIYSWRGANIQNILDFEKDYQGAKVVRLEQNYRSKTNILEAANGLIAQNEGRYEKNLWSQLGAGEKVKIYKAETDRDEVRYVADTIRRHRYQGVPLNDMVIFYRTNFQSRIFEDALHQRNIPYVIVGGISFYQRREIKDIVAYLRIVQSGEDYVSFERTINVPKRGLGATTVDKLRSGAEEVGMTVFDFCHRIVATAEPFSGVTLTPKIRVALKQYVEVILELRAIHEQQNVKELVEAAIQKTGYGSHLANDAETYEDRWDNLREFISIAAEWQEAHEEGTLIQFLEELSLKSSLDEAEGDVPRVNLMTLHNGKGLEFTVAFLVGLEEELFPHVNARLTPEGLEEERRLCYVGMTRAKEYLYLSSAKQRLLWGSVRRMRPSRFLMEIPSEYVEEE